MRPTLNVGLSGGVAEVEGRTVGQFTTGKSPCIFTKSLRSANQDMCSGWTWSCNATRDFYPCEEYRLDIKNCDVCQSQGCDDCHTGACPECAERSFNCGPREGMRLCAALIKGSP
eukprot:GEMP01092040.1.p1 GENE.GEMP01092040.1~~GEMP01092040.1.p1  ORF type:complete len:115 (+),score=19.58 GEMP01092040.1:139-483(+)